MYTFKHEAGLVSEIEVTPLPRAVTDVVGFARDGKGEVYVISYGALYKLIPATAQSPDFNSDGIANIHDLIFLLNRFSQPAPAGAPNAIADFKTDALINTPDLIYFLNRFGTTCP